MFERLSAQKTTTQSPAAPDDLCTHLHSRPASSSQHTDCYQQFPGAETVLLSYGEVKAGPVKPDPPQPVIPPKTSSKSNPTTRTSGMENGRAEAYLLGRVRASTALHKPGSKPIANSRTLMSRLRVGGLLGSIQHALD